MPQEAARPVADRSQLYARRMGVTTPVERLAVETYIEDVERRLRARTNEGPEALLAAPLRTLVRQIADARGRPDVDLLDQAVESGIGRPDFAAKDGPLLIGHVETKQLGAGVRTNRYTGHDRRQWENFARLPNVLYSDGREFGLYRSGELVELGPGQVALARLPLDPQRQGPLILSDIEIGELVTLADAFLGWQPISPRSLGELADRLAPLVATLRDSVREALRNPESQVSGVTHDVRDTLFPKADDDALADAYAQTCAYSVLLAQSEGAPALDPPAVEATLTHAHPVLARVVRVLLDPDAEQEIAWAVEVVRRQVGAVDFYLLTEEGTDTWLYFYEHFLAAYDPKLRNDRGVYYTPRQVIAAQVALCEDVLQTRFGKELGFAETDVTVVDPGVGTGSYPLAVIDAAAKAASRLGEGFAATAVSNLATRLHGFEILVGPYSVSHLRLTEAIRQKSAETPEGGVNVYLTDTLASPNTEPPLIGSLAPLVREQRRALTFKAQTPVVVCLGNPPYDRESHTTEEHHEGPRKGGWVRYGDPGQVEHVRPILDDWLEPLSDAGLGVHAKNLYNDYVYFWRWAIWKVFQHHPAEVEQRGGIVTFISAASFLRGIAFSFMRSQMRQLCDDIYVIDLGGEGRGTRRSENVFDIQTPVAITICVRDPGEGERAGRVHFVDWSEGTREEKFGRLEQLRTIADIDWREGPAGGTDPFVPVAEGDWADWPQLVDIFPWRHSGVQLKRTWPIAPTEETLHQRWASLVSSTDDERAALFHETRDRTIQSQPPPLLLGAVGRPPIGSLTALDVLADEDLVPYEFRTLDREYIIRDERIGDFLKPALWRTHSDRQLYLATLTTHPLGDGPAVSIASASPPDLHYYRGSFGGADTMPLFRDSDALRPNLPAGLVAQLEELYGRPVAPEDVFAYVTGVLGTTAYTERFVSQLGEAGPRVPLTGDDELFGDAAELGRRLAFLHSRGRRYTRPDWRLPDGTARILRPIPGSQNENPETVEYVEQDQEIRIGTGAVGPVSNAVWEFQTSGYAVVQEWIKRRLSRPRGRTSSELDLIRPIAWTVTMQRELLQLVHTIEEIVDDLTPRATALLDEICSGELLAAADLPAPTDQERRPPRAA
jgi:hypothetical protein